MSSEMPKFFEYMKLIGNLKRVKRTGWVNHGVKQPESVAEHMYRMAMISFALPADSTLDRDKCMKIALVHDVGESIVGDLTPNCGVSKADKSSMEEKATAHISSFLPGHAAEEVLQLWKEYENQSSPEAKFVKDVDKFEMIFQATEYEKAENRTGELEEFFDHTMTQHTFSSDIVQKWADDIVTVRSRVKDQDWENGLVKAKQSIVTSLPALAKSSSSSSSPASPKSLQSPKEALSAAGKKKINASGDKNL